MVVKHIKKAVISTDRAEGVLAGILSVAAIFKNSIRITLNILEKY